MNCRWLKYTHCSGVSRGSEHVSRNSEHVFTSRTSLFTRKNRLFAFSTWYREEDTQTPQVNTTTSQVQTDINLPVNFVPCLAFILSTSSSILLLMVYSCGRLMSCPIWLCGQWPRRSKLIDVCPSCRLRQPFLYIHCCVSRKLNLLILHSIFKSILDRWFFIGLDYEGWSTCISRPPPLTEGTK